MIDDLDFFDFFAIFYTLRLMNTICFSNQFDFDDDDFFFESF